MWFDLNFSFHCIMEWDGNEEKKKTIKSRCCDAIASHTMKQNKQNIKRTSFIFSSVVSFRLSLLRREFYLVFARFPFLRACNCFVFGFFSLVVGSSFVSFVHVYLFSSFVICVLFFIIWNFCFYCRLCHCHSLCHLIAVAVAVAIAIATVIASAYCPLFSASPFFSGPFENENTNYNF